MKQRIKQWIADRSVVNMARLKTLRAEMVRWDKRAEDSDLSQSQADQLCAVRCQYFQAEKELSQQLKQKSRVKWALEGDENVAFFHGMVKGRLNGNSIKGLNINGCWTEEPQKLKDVTFNFFKEHFLERLEDRPSFTSDKFRKLTEEQIRWLEMEFTVDEIKQPVWDCEGSKAPRPDGFTFNFIKKTGRW